ncbi:hypothetical protein [Pyrolobus fumarii]|uniref:hypothetical protein n=1 Tax=Pyrolobus fumarii TaxID=54252 RepID=UPI00064EE2D8|nr:hypothetical protein [Pyrolobus fumarii]
MTAVGAEQPRPAPDEYLDSLRAAGRRDWIPEECSVDGDLVTCPREALRRLLLAAAVAIFKQRLLERALREHEDLYERLREKLEAVEAEVGWLEEELAGLERLVGSLLGLQPRVEELLREVGEARREAARLLERVGRWTSVWECSYSIPHPETIRRRCRRNRRLCILADRVQRAKAEWYDFLWSLPVLELGEGRVLLFREVDARRLEEVWRRLFDGIVEGLRREGYRTRASCTCIKRLVAPEQLVRDVEAEAERLRGEIERLVARSAELARMGRSASSILRRAEKLRERLAQLEQILRELREKLPRDARAKAPTAVARG